MHYYGWPGFLPDLDASISNAFRHTAFVMSLLMSFRVKPHLRTLVSRYPGYTTRSFQTSYLLTLNGSVGQGFSSCGDGPTPAAACCRWQARQSFAGVGNAALTLSMQAMQWVEDPAIQARQGIGEADL